MPDVHRRSPTLLPWTKYPNKMIRRKINILLCVTALALAACNDNALEIAPIVPDSNQIEIQAEICQSNPSRANDNGFGDGDAIGVTVDNQSNVRFAYNDATKKWTSTVPLYWPSANTATDIWAYYPFTQTVPSVENHPFTTERNQSAGDAKTGKANYELSDFLCTYQRDVSPSKGVVNLSFKHVMACVQVRLEEGKFFADGEWNKLDKSVLVSNVKREGTINIKDESAVANGDAPAEAIIPIVSGDAFRAVVFPQTVSANQTVIAVTVDGQTYNLVRPSGMTYKGGNMHKFTIRVNKRLPQGDYEFELADMAITAWESDLVSHNGASRAYVVVENPEFGGLKQAVEKSGLTPIETVNLKITGKMNHRDFEFLRNNFKYLQALNLREAVLENDEIPEDAFHEMRNLNYFDFPKKVRDIGSGAFYSTMLCGSLVIPEGVERIGGHCFGGYGSDCNNFSGTLTLPSTLKRIEESAFWGCQFSGQLLLSDNLEYIGGSAFMKCRNITGSIYIPESVKEIGSGAFRFMSGLTGPVEIPQGVTRIYSNTFECCGIIYYSLHEGITSIDHRAFAGCGINGDIALPNSITKIESEAFRDNKIKHIKLPDNITYIPGGCFANTSLIDTLTIPDNVEVIDERAFQSCRYLDAIILPAKLQSIKEFAFEFCYSLQYVRCLSKEPPQLHETAFNSIAKDNFTIEVPEGSVEAYRNAPGWKEFKRISTYKNFVARPSIINVLNNGGTRKVILNADATWEMIDKPDWVTVTPTSGNKKTELTVTISKMAHGSRDRTGDIVFKLNDAEGHTCTMNLGQYDYEYDEDQTLVLNEPKTGPGIDVMIIGDGYDARDISAGIYLETMKRVTEDFFAVEPYATYRDYFRVSTAIAMSDESGVGTLNTLRRCKFETGYGDGAAIETRIHGNDALIAQYLLDQVPSVNKSNWTKATIICIANADEYDGVCAMYSSGPSIAYIPATVGGDALESRRLVHHEACGHGFGKLADEYISHNSSIHRCCCICCEHAEGLLAAQSIGWFRNVSLNYKFTTVEWAHLMRHPKYASYVDIFEGGFKHRYGVFRSEPISCMAYNDPYFSAWSRQVIVERIKNYAGEKFDFDDFVAKDKDTWGVVNSRGGYGGSVTPRVDKGPRTYYGSPLDKYPRSLSSTIKKGGKK